MIQIYSVILIIIIIREGEWHNDMQEMLTWSGVKPAMAFYVGLYTVSSNHWTGQSTALFDRIQTRALFLMSQVQLSSQLIHCWLWSTIHQ